MFWWGVDICAKSLFERSHFVRLNVLDNNTTLYDKNGILKSNGQFEYFSVKVFRVTLIIIFTVLFLR